MTIKFVKETLNEQKSVYTFLIGKHHYMLEKAKNNETFGNCQATYQKELCWLFE